MTLSVVPDWRGETCFILGGGPSLAEFDAATIMGFPVIGINEAGLTLAPWCDILFWSDDQWLEWNRDRLSLHHGGLRFHRHHGTVPGATHLPFRYKVSEGMHWGKNEVGGCDSGSSAINLAVHTGASTIVLLGFDMSDGGPNNFHDRHQVAHDPQVVTDRFIPAHNAMAADLASHNHPVKVLNATPTTRLTCWPRTDLKEVLSARDSLSAAKWWYLHRGSGPQSHKNDPF
jgi:hypothetical protein